MNKLKFIFKHNSNSYKQEANKLNLCQGGKKWQNVPESGKLLKSSLILHSN